MRVDKRSRDVPEAHDARAGVELLSVREQAVGSRGRAERLRTVADDARPAFYALKRGGWRDYITLLHPPYTLWHLSYVVLGAALAPTVRYDRLAATLLAFFLAVGVSAHALDELNGRPLQTRIPRSALVGLGISGLAGAIVIGVIGVVFASPWLLAFVAFGAFIAPAYSLEWFRGRFHSDFWFAFAWGVFPFRRRGHRRHLGARCGRTRAHANRGGDIRPQPCRAPCPRVTCWARGTRNGEGARRER